MEVPFATKRGYSTDGYTLFHVGQHNSMLAEAVLSAYGPWWKNFRATLELTPRSVDQASGMVFRLNDQGFYAFLLCQPSRTPGVFVKVVRRQFDGHSTDIAGWQPAGVLPGPIPAHRQITVEARGDSFKFFVDGRLVIELRDSMMEDGLVGMAAYGLGTSRFHDLLVEELP
jgi:hypothetical protein